MEYINQTVEQTATTPSLSVEDIKELFKDDEDALFILEDYEGLYSDANDLAVQIRACVNEELQCGELVVDHLDYLESIRRILNKLEGVELRREIVDTDNRGETATNIISNDVVVKKIDDEKFDYLVFSLTSESPLFQLAFIKETLANAGRIDVLFDQLLQTGDSSNRFLSVTFENGDFDFITAKQLDCNEIDKSIKMIIAEYLRQNVLILEHSILLSRQKEIIKNGGII